MEIKNTSNEAEIKSLMEKLQTVAVENSQLKIELQSSIGPVSPFPGKKMNRFAQNGLPNANTASASVEPIEGYKGITDVKIDIQYQYNYTAQENGLFTCNLCIKSFEYKQKKHLFEHQRYRHFNVPEKPKARNTAKDKATRKLREQKRNNK